MARQSRSNALQNSSSQLSSKADPRVIAALQALESTGTAAGLDQAARAVNLSVSRLRHLIRAELGIPPHRYVKECRLLHARELLENTFLTVKEVASAAGFDDISHFLRDYKLQFGETPSKTRRKHTTVHTRTPVERFCVFCSTFLLLRLYDFAMMMSQ